MESKPQNTTVPSLRKLEERCSNLIYQRSFIHSSPSPTQRTHLYPLLPGHLSTRPPPPHIQSKVPGKGDTFKDWGFGSLKRAVMQSLSNGRCCVFCRLHGPNISPRTRGIHSYLLHHHFVPTKSWDVAGGDRKTQAWIGVYPGLLTSLLPCEVPGKMKWAKSQVAVRAKSLRHFTTLYAHEEIQQNDRRGR